MSSVGPIIYLSDYIERLLNFIAQPFVKLLQPFAAILYPLYEGIIGPQPPRRVYVCGRTGPTCPYYGSARVVDQTADRRDIYAWPSCGGVIVLAQAEEIDFQFLDLDAEEPPHERFEDQEAEDAFCQRLLLLGATWWDSEMRLSDVAYLLEERLISPVEHGIQPPTLRERRFVKVGWPSSGGLWVAEFDTAALGLADERSLLPVDEDSARRKLQEARTMGERCDILQHWFGAHFYESLAEYHGEGFLSSWTTKETGEVGPLLRADETEAMWRAQMDVG